MPTPTNLYHLRTLAMEFSRIRQHNEMAAKAVITISMTKREFDDINMETSMGSYYLSDPTFKINISRKILPPGNDTPVGSVQVEDVFTVTICGETFHIEFKD